MYPLEGRLVHEGLAALCAYRISRLQPISFSIAVNDFGLKLLSAESAPLERALDAGLFAVEHLSRDVLASLNSVEMARRQFREIARVAGLVFQGFPGAGKSVKQLQATSGLVFDVFENHDPLNPLLKQARAEVLDRQLEQSRLADTLDRIAGSKILLVETERPTPFAFPLLVDRLRRSCRRRNFLIASAKCRWRLRTWPTAPRGRPADERAARGRTTVNDIREAPSTIPEVMGLLMHMDVTVEIVGEKIALLPERALYRPVDRTLIVADPHWGKGAAFRAGAVPIPGADLHADLERLSRALERVSATRLVVLGDLLHAREDGNGVCSTRSVAGSRGTRVSNASWCAATTTRRRAIPRRLGFPGRRRAACRRSVRVPPFPRAERCRICVGRSSPPGARLFGRGDQSLRLPCFHAGPRVMVLPAFGSFTGLATVKPKPGDGLHVIADGEVIPILHRDNRKPRSSVHRPVDRPHFVRGHLPRPAPGIVDSCRLLRRCQDGSVAAAGSAVTDTITHLKLGVFDRGSRARGTSTLTSG